MVKICPKCRSKFPATTEFFYPNKGQKNNLSPYCRSCTLEYINSDKTRNRLYKKRYGITIEEYDLIYSKQNGCCAICGVHQSDLNKRLSIDHNHKTGRVRGLLCDRCNRLIGFSNEEIIILRNAIKYLRIY